MKKIVSVFLVLVFIISCSPQKRLNRLLRKHPHLSNTEMVVFRDTIIRPEVQLDSVFSVNFDTVYLENERISVKLIKTDSLIYLTGISKTDTIFYEKKVPVKLVKITETSFYKKLREWAIVGLIVIAFLYLIAFISNARRR